MKDTFAQSKQSDPNGGVIDRKVRWGLVWRVRRLPPSAKPKGPELKVEGFSLLDLLVQPCSSLSVAYTLI